jgi:hypothetical protein
MDTANQTNNRQLTTDNREPRQLGRGRMDKSQEVILQHSDFGCGSAALVRIGMNSFFFRLVFIRV